MRVIKEDGFVKVDSPYNDSFVRAARRLNGKWSSPYWVFKDDLEEEIMGVLADIYGYGEEKVDVILTFDPDKSYSFFGNESCYLAGKLAFQRRYRDRDVSIHEDISILSGSFYSSGGSMKHPTVSMPKDGEFKILLRNCPKNKLHELDSVGFYEIKQKDEVKSKYSDFTFEQLADMMAEIEKEMHKRMDNMKSHVMKMAWDFYKSEKYDTFSESLKNAWAEVKKNV